MTLIVFFFLITFLKNTAFKPWLVFVYGVLASAIVLLVWDFIYHHRFLRMIDTTIIIWIGTLSVYLTLVNVIKNSPAALAFIFIVAVPLQILEVIWFFFHRNKKRTGSK